MHLRGERDRRARVFQVCAASSEGGAGTLAALACVSRFDSPPARDDRRRARLEWTRCQRVIAAAENPPCPEHCHRSREQIISRHVTLTLDSGPTGADRLFAPPAVFAFARSAHPQ
ncbi:hypothetical protein MTO96_001076 [Rhipicephalus appendiculatus]